MAHYLGLNNGFVWAKKFSKIFGTTRKETVENEIIWNTVELPIRELYFHSVK